MLDDLLDHLDVEVWFTELPGFACGRTVYSQGVRRIEVAHTGRSEWAQTFTLAHEIGHCLIDDWRDASKAPNYLPTDSAAIETLCNRIGAELVLPTSWMTQQLADMTRFSVDELQTVANAADTSLTAVLIRALQLRAPVVGKIFHHQADNSWRLARSYGRETPNPTNGPHAWEQHEAQPHRHGTPDLARELPPEVALRLSPQYEWTWRRSANAMWVIGSRLNPSSSARRRAARATGMPADLDQGPAR